MFYDQVKGEKLNKNLVWTNVDNTEKYHNGQRGR